MARRFAPEVHDFIRAHVDGTSVKELAALVTRELGVSFTEGQMKSYLGNHHLTNGHAGSKKIGYTSLFPEEIYAYIVENHKGCGPTEMTEKVNARFGTHYDRSQVKAFYHNRKLNSGITGQFQPGHVSHNKGQKGVYTKGCERTWFKPGGLPPNTRPIGYERVTKEGYTEVKIRMRPTRPYSNDNFKMKHRIIWEQMHGPLGPDDVVIFKDCNKRNFDPENLMAVTRAERLEMSRLGLFTMDADLTESGALVAKLVRQIRDKEKARTKK